MLVKTCNKTTGNCLELILIAPYHPQVCNVGFLVRCFNIILFIRANGLDKCFNQALQDMLVKFVAKHNESWSCFLDVCCISYNTSIQASTV